MQGARYLLQRPSGFYLRVAIPEDLRIVLGVRELTRALNSRNRREALSRCRRIGLGLRALFDDVRLMSKDPTNRLTPARFRAWVLDFLREELDRFDAQVPSLPSTDRKDWDTAAEAEAEALLGPGLDGRHPNANSDELARAVLAPRGLELDRLEPRIRSAVRHDAALARAHLFAMKAEAVELPQTYPLRGRLLRDWEARAAQEVRSQAAAPMQALSTEVMRQMQSLDIEAGRMKVSPWLREREAVMLFAATGVGKSQVAMSLALAVAGGRSAFGWQAPAPRPVLYVDGEMDREDLADRIRDLRKAIGAEDCEECLDNLHLLARDACRPGVPFPDLGTDEGHAAVLAFAQRVGAALVILDNLSTLATVEDENSAAAIKKPIELVQKLRQSGCATLLVHHSDKSGSTYRGSSNLATTFAWVVGLHRPKDAESFGMDATLQWHKTRGLTDESMTLRRLRLVTGQDGAATWEVTEPEDLQTVRLAKAIRSRRFVNLTEAAEAIGLGKTQGYVVARRLPTEAGLDDAEMKAHFRAARELRQAEATGQESEDF